MPSPKLSVIIPVYNTAEYLDKCMESVLGQTFSDGMEIILIDDGSTDGISPKMCDGYAARDDRIVVIHKNNGGLMSAWMEGVKRATADYLSFIDSDDWVDTDMLEKLYACTDSSFASSEIIAGNYIVEKAGERRNERQSLPPGVYTGSSLDSVRKNLLGNEVRPVTMSRCMKLISKKLVLDNIRYCNTEIAMGEDVNIMLPCLCDCRRLVILKDSYFYHYRLVGGSMVHGYNPGLLDNLGLTDRTFRGILKDKMILNADHQMDREFVIMLLVVLKNELRCRDKETVGRIKRLFLRKGIREKVMSTEVSISSGANRLLYFCIKHPNFLTINVSKLIISAYDMRTNQCR